MSVEPPGGEFVDTNVLVYAFDRNAGEKRRVASELVERLWETRRGWISLQVMQEFYVSTTRKLKLAPGEAALQIHRLKFWRVYRPSVDDVFAAIELHQGHTVSFWDALILRSAQAARCSVLWSEDLQHGRRWADLEVRNPFAE